MRHRSLLNAIVLGGLAVALLAGCSRPPGTDGNIADDWPALPAVKSWTPEVGACYRGFLPTATIELPAKLACDGEHVAETLHVGTFEERAVLPPDGSPEQRKAYEECRAKATEFLGDDWRNGRLYLGVAHPSAAAWDGGARWFRCDVMEVDAETETDGKSRTGSLKDALRGGRPLAYGCSVVSIKNDEIDSAVPTDCTKPHNAEFTGIFDLPDGPYSTDDKQRENAAIKGCYPIVARFASVPNDRNLEYRAGLVWTWPSRAEWARGNRGLSCELWLDKNVSRSMKGAGPSVLPAT